MKKGLFILVCALTLLACKKENNCFIPAGKKSSQTTYLDNFSSVTFNYFMDFNWVESNEVKMVVEGGENFIPEISSEITNGNLDISNNNGCKVMRGKVDDITVTLYCPQIDTFTLKGNGKISFKDTIKNDFHFNSIANQGSVELKFNNNFTKFYLESGSTDITITGNNRYCDYYNSGIVHFYAKEFQVDSFRCHSRANGITEIRANEWLHIEQNGTGDIQYWGNPNTVTITSQLGEGAIINRGN